MGGTVVLTWRGREVARWELEGVDLQVVDELARLVLAGMTVRIRGAPAELVGLLRVCGLLRREVGGEVEVGEEVEV
jgi:hypothetical protein